MSVFEEAAERLTAAAQKNSRLLISYSGGKDSMVVLDMASRCGFTEIIGIFFYMVPGLPMQQKQLQWAKDTYGMNVLQYPTPNLIRVLQAGVFCNPSFHWDHLRPYTLHELYQLAFEDTGINVIATGMKKADGLSRRQNFANLSKCKGGTVVMPLENWKKYDVMAYVKIHELPIPPTSGGITTGVGLGARELLWLHDTQPESFAVLLNYFPFAEAVIKRRDWYGIGKYQSQGEVAQG